MKRLAVAICLLALVFVLPALAQTASSPTVVKDSTAIALTQKSLNAMAGTSPGSYQDSLASGSMIYHGGQDLTVPVILKSKGTSKTRWEIQKNEGADISVNDGTSGCISQAVGGKIRTSASDQISKRIDYIPALSLLAEYASANVNVQYGGTATVNGSTTDVVALSISVSNMPLGFDSLKLTQHLFYIDRISGYVTKILLYRADGDSPSTSKIEMYFSSYKIFNGIAVPMKRSLYVDGRLASDLTLSSIAFNTGLADSEFVPACGGAQ